MALAVSLPFELKSPVASVAGLSITNVEIAMYAAIALWGVALILGRRMLRPWTPSHSAVLAWAAVLVISAAAASVDRAGAMKFALRGAGGCMLLVLVADVTTTKRRAALVSSALALGAVASALTAPVEIWLPRGEASLSLFKTQASYAGGFLRASGTFQYANTAAMYWEAMLPVVLAVGVWWLTVSVRPRHQWATMGAGIALGLAIVLSASRAALWISGLTAILLAATSGRTSRLIRVPAWSVVATLTLMTMAGPGHATLLALRLRSSAEARWLQAGFAGVPASLQVSSGDMLRVPLALQNTGMLDWSPAGRNPVHLSYHWYQPDGDTVVAWEGARTKLPSEVRSGSEVTLPALVHANVPPGRYLLEWDVVQEHTAWFSMLGSGPQRTARTWVIVTPPAAVQSAPVLPAPFKLTFQARPSRPALWRAAYQIWRERPFLGAGPDSYRHQYGARLGVADADSRTHASSLYVEIAATMGLLGLAALTAIVVSLAAATRRAWQIHPAPADRVLVVGLALGVGAFLVHGLVDYFLSFTPTYGLFWTLSGLLVGLSQQERIA